MILLITANLYRFLSKKKHFQKNNLVKQSLLLKSKSFILLKRFKTTVHIHKKIFLRVYANFKTLNYNKTSKKSRKEIQNVDKTGVIGQSIKLSVGGSGRVYGIVAAKNVCPKGKF